MWRRHSTRGAAVHQILFYPLCTAAKAAIYIAAAVHKPQYMRDKKAATVEPAVAPQLAVVGRIQLAAASQWEPFYTIPHFYLLLKNRKEKYVFLSLNQNETKSPDRSLFVLHVMGMSKKDLKNLEIIQGTEKHILVPFSKVHC